MTICVTTKTWKETPYLKSQTLSWLLSHSFHLCRPKASAPGGAYGLDKGAA